MIPRSLILATLALTACFDTRQLTLSIRTTAGVPCDIDSVRVVATAGGTTTIDQTLRGERLPVEIPLLDDTPDGAFEVDISGYKGGVEVMRVTGPLRFSDHATVAQVLLERRCRPEAGCGLADAMAAAANAGPADPACVADVTRYAGGAGIDPFADVCSVPNAQKALVDGSAGPIELTALAPELAADHFQFFGRQITNVWVAREGYVSFAQDNPDPGHVLVPGALDRELRHAGAAPPPHSVMAFWDALTLGASGVCYVIDGEANHHVLRLSWTRACLTMPCGTDNLNFGVTVDEDTGRIAVSYGEMTSSNSEGALGLSATVGIVDDARGCPADQCALATGLCADGVTPCGYTQVFSNTAQAEGVKAVQFTPIIAP